MVKQFVRRSVFAVVFGVVGMAAVGTAVADDGSGTDMCPKNTSCSTSNSSMAMSSNAMAVVQVMLMMVGMS